MTKRSETSNVNSSPVSGVDAKDPSDARQLEGERKTSRRLRWPSFKMLVHLRWLSWVVLVVTTSGMTLIIVPGMPGLSPVFLQDLGDDVYERWWDGTTDLFADYADSWSHGWPFEYLSRPAEFSDWLLVFDDFPVQWSSPNAWPQPGEVYRFSLVNLLTDLAIGVMIVLACVASCEFWRRRRGAFRVTLLDIVIFVTCVCLVSGWYASHKRSGAREQAIARRLVGGRDGSRTYGRPNFTRHYHGPVWLLRLAGNPLFLDFCTHVDSITLDTQILTESDLADLRTLTYLESVGCCRTLTPELVEALSTLPRLRALDGNDYEYSWPRRTPPMVTSAEVELLPRLPRLTTLKLGCSQLVPDDLAVLVRLPALQTLQFFGDDLLVDDLAPLDGFPALRRVMADITATKEELRAFQARRSRYRLTWNEYRDVDAWDVARFRIARWGGDPSLSPNTMLDLTGILLNGDRLKKLTPILPEVSELRLGEVDSTQTVLELIARCRPLCYLDALHVPLSKQDLSKIRFASDAELYVQQGNISAEQFAAFLRDVKAKLVFLTIFGSTFTIAEARTIEASRPDCFIEVHRSPVDDGGEPVYPSWFEDVANPFSPMDDGGEPVYPP